MGLTSSVAVIAGRGHSLCGGISAGRVSRHKASTVTVSVLADIEDTVGISVGPDIEVLDNDIGARNILGAVHLDRTPLSTIRSGSSPRTESNVRVSNTVTINNIHRGPGGVEIQSVGVGVAHEVGEGEVLDGATSTIGLDHVHLI